MVVHRNVAQSQIDPDMLGGSASVVEVDGDAVDRSYVSL